MDYHIPLLADNYYHIVSRAIGNEKLFTEYENYRFFLKKYESYIQPVADTLAYALLPNHFHFLIRIKSYEELAKEFLTGKKKKKLYDGWQPKFVMQQFSNLLNCYAKSFNKKYDRLGGLFIDYLRRKLIETDEQLTATIFYIHKNPVQHGYCKKITDWHWTSYKTIMNDNQTFINSQEVIDWFGSRESFSSFHSQPIHLKKAIILEY